MSTSSKAGGGSRASDEDGRTSVKVGKYLERLLSARPNETIDASNMANTRSSPQPCASGLH